MRETETISISKPYFKSGSASACTHSSLGNNKFLLRRQPVTPMNRLCLVIITLLMFILVIDKVSAEISPLDLSSAKLRHKLYKDLPFEPLTKQRHANPVIGNTWKTFTIKPDDTFYSLVLNNDLNINDLHEILELGHEANNLKNLKPGQNIRIRFSETRILELIHELGSGRILRVNREQDKFIATISINGDQNVIENTAERVAVEIPDPVRSTTILANQFSISNDLDDRPDTILQSKLESTIQSLGLMDQVKNKKLAVALVDITDSRNPHLAMLNGNEMMYAASLPKIAILLGAFVDIEQGQMTLDQQTRESLTKMIRFSSNDSATEMLRRVGKNNLRAILTSDRYHFYDRSKNGGLWVGKEYGKKPAFQRDPIHNLSHGATAFQAARFYYLLETEQLVSPSLCKEMKDILSKPEIHHKFVKGLENHPEAKIYRKSGSWRQWHSDSALVEANGYKYIAIALSENPQGGKWLSDMIGPFHDLIVPQSLAGIN